MPTVAAWSGIAFATVGALFVSVSLTLTSVPTVQVRPELIHLLTLLPLSILSKDVVTRTRVALAPVAGVTLVLRSSVSVPLPKYKSSIV